MAKKNAAKVVKAAKVAKPVKSTRGRKQSALLDVTLKQITGWIKEGYTVGAIAEFCGCARLTLYRRFPEVKGLSPRGRRAA